MPRRRRRCGRGRLDRLRDELAQRRNGSIRARWSEVTPIVSHNRPVKWATLIVAILVSGALGAFAVYTFGWRNGSTTTDQPSLTPCPRTHTNNEIHDVAVHSISCATATSIAWDAADGQTNGFFCFKTGEGTKPNGPAGITAGYTAWRCTKGTQRTFTYRVYAAD